MFTRPLFTSRDALSFVVAATVFAAAPASALIIPVNTSYNGAPNIKIGEIDARLTLNGAGTAYVETGIFTFTPRYAKSLFALLVGLLALGLDSAKLRSRRVNA